ncbi:ribonuclease III domain-containing protein [Gongronella butleri]|nr:ribonuclease III domain-containing protein [Gongronella butleri]
MVLSRCRPLSARLRLFGAQRAFHQSCMVLNNAALFSFRHRLNMGAMDDSVVQQAVTHHSFDENSNNDALAEVGRHAIAYYTLEYLHGKYPNLPSDAFKAVHGAYRSNATLSQLGERVGVQHVMRWERPQELEDSIKEGHQAAVVSCVRALVGALYQAQPESAKQFVHEHLLSRPVDLTPVLESTFANPKRQLTAELRRRNQKPAVSRLLSESGRLSRAPVFVVGVFSAEKKLGEGFGSSKKMAEHRACRDALLQFYGVEQKDFMLPSDNGNYTPPVLGDTHALA